MITTAVHAAIPLGAPPTKLKARRLLLGLSQLEVANASSGRLNREGISRFEAGESWPNPRHLQALADVYGCPRDTILAESMQAWLNHNEEQVRG